MPSNNLLVIGYGNMGQPIVDAAVKVGFKPFIVLHQDDEVGLQKAQTSGLEYSIQSVPDVQFDYVLVAIKPQDIQVAVKYCEGMKSLEKAKIISVLAGVTTQKLESLFKGAQSIVRLMPNLALSTGKSYTMAFASNTHGAQDTNINQLLNQFGEYNFADNEDWLDIVTPVSGSSPAYFAYFVNAIVDSAVNLGLPKDIAMQALIHTINGVLEIFASKQDTPEQLIKRVCSRGGVTLEGIKSLKNNDFATIIDDCVVKSYQKSKELSENG